jgi:hypothetical protein
LSERAVVGQKSGQCPATKSSNSEEEGADSSILGSIDFDDNHCNDDGFYRAFNATIGTTGKDTGPFEHATVEKHAYERIPNSIAEFFAAGRSQDALETTIAGDPSASNDRQATNNFPDDCAFSVDGTALLDAFIMNERLSGGRAPLPPTGGQPPVQTPPLWRAVKRHGRDTKKQLMRVFAAKTDLFEGALVEFENFTKLQNFTGSGNGAPISNQYVQQQRKLSDRCNALYDEYLNALFDYKLVLARSPKSGEWENTDGEALSLRARFDEAKDASQQVVAAILKIEKIEREISLLGEQLRALEEALIELEHREHFPQLPLRAVANGYVRTYQNEAHGMCKKDYENVLQEYNAMRNQFAQETKKP